MSEVVDNISKHRFEIDLGDGSVAFAEYRLEGERIIFPHTVVPPKHEGKGIASRLAKAALAFARQRGLKVVPRCAFFAGYMKKHPETHDLLAPDGRAIAGV